MQDNLNLTVYEPTKTVAEEELAIMSCRMCAVSKFETCDMYHSDIRPWPERLADRSRLS